MHEVNYANIPTATLAAMIATAQEVMRERLAADLPEKVHAAIVAETQRVATDTEQMHADREARRGKVLDAFTAYKVEVPALNLGDVTDLALTVSAVTRSPYNKVLYRAGRDTLKPDEATYGRLAEVHEEFMAGEPAPKLSEPVAEPVSVVAAKVEAEVEAKVTRLKVDKPMSKTMRGQVDTLIRVLNLDEAEATRRVLALA